MTKPHARFIVTAPTVPDLHAQAAQTMKRAGINEEAYGFRIGTAEPAGYIDCSTIDRPMGTVVEAWQAEVTVWREEETSE